MQKYLSKGFDYIINKKYKKVSEIQINLLGIKTYVYTDNLIYVKTNKQVNLERIFNLLSKSYFKISYKIF